MKFIDPDLFSDFSRETILSKIGKMHFHATHWHFETDSNIRNFNLQVLSGNIFATFHAIFVTITPVTPEIMPGDSATFGTRLQKSAYFTKYLSKYWTNIYY